MRPPIVWLGLTFALVASAFAQGTKADYERSATLQQRTAGKVFRDELKPTWLPGGTQFWYRNTLPDRKREFILVNAETGERRLAFDHAAVSVMLGALRPDLQEAADRLDISIIGIDPDVRAVDFTFGGKAFRLQSDGSLVGIKDSGSASEGLPNLGEPRPSREGGPETTITFLNRTSADVQCFWIGPDGSQRAYATIKPGESYEQHTYAAHVWVVKSQDDRVLGVFQAQANGGTAVVERNPGTPALQPRPRRRGRERSSDSSIWRAAIRDHNVVLRHRETDEEVWLTNDGTAEYSYSEPLHWSPDGKKLVAYHAKHVEDRKIHFVESSPKDQLQPKLHTLDYAKPGDEIRQPKPRLFDVEGRRAIPIDEKLFPNPWSITSGQWSEDGSEYRFLYNERGHQILRMLALNAATGSVRAIVEETSPTFIDYSQKSFHHWVRGTGELIWMSERDGWNHLWLYDAATGAVKNRITKGPGLVRRVERVDEERRQIWFAISGHRLSEDPYHIHLARVNFDGTGLTILTEGDGTHTWEFSPDRQYIVDKWSRVDHPPVSELRRAQDGKLVCILEKADASALVAAGWEHPESFTAKGRDGVTDIYGIIIRPSNFDPTRKYPVLENIYAGPHGAFVPKEWSRFTRSHSLAELGFIVVQIDGMGTNWRGKKFHDIAWRNVADSGFPDRIAWMRAAAQKYPEMDLTRVGIFAGALADKAHSPRCSITVISITLQSPTAAAMTIAWTRFGGMKPGSAIPSGRTTRRTQTSRTLTS